MTPEIGDIWACRSGNHYLLLKHDCLMYYYCLHLEAGVIGYFYLNHLSGFKVA